MLLLSHFLDEATSCFSCVMIPICFLCHCVKVLKRKMTVARVSSRSYCAGESQLV